MRRASRAPSASRSGANAGAIEASPRRPSKAGKLAAIDILAVLEPRAEPLGLVMQSGPFGSTDRHGEKVFQIAVAACRRAGIVHVIVRGLGQRFVFGDLLPAVLVRGCHHSVSVKKSRISM